MTDSEKDKNNSRARQALLKKLPGIDHILEVAKADEGLESIPKTVLTASARQVVDQCRNQIMDNSRDIRKEDLADAAILNRVRATVESAMSMNLVRTINATGVVVHTNLGRSLLAREALDHLQAIASRYSNLEFNLATGKRGLRYTIVEDLICEISGAEAAMVVNNNAGAVLLCLDTVARNREVIVSRGELVEIGGSFRIPDVMGKSGAILKEVGTTNRTHLSDYKTAINDNTGLLLKVHTSNFGIIGFTSSVPLKELVELGKLYHLPVMEDLGSGTFVDFSKYGLAKEPTAAESVAAGADIVTFSGDKLLGGPQAGIIAGSKNIIDKIKQNPLTRALRIDKLTLAALEGTLRLYRDEAKAVASIPTLCMLTCPIEEIEEKAIRLKNDLDQIADSRLQTKTIDSVSRAGGGSFPLLDLPSRCVSIRIQGMSAARIEKQMRENDPPIIGRIVDDMYLMDMRTVLQDELPEIVDALKTCLKRG